MKWYMCWDEINRNISQKITEKICRETNNIVCYGINLLINGIEKFTILMISFYILGYMKLFMISVIIMFSLRIWIGGTHRKSLMGCLIQSEVMFITIICVNNIIHISAIEQTIIMLIIITVDIACCPVIDGRRGKYSHRKIMKFKIYSVMDIVLLNITAFMCARYEELLVACELVQLIEIVTSKLLQRKGEKYENEAH